MLSDFLWKMTSYDNTEKIAVIKVIILGSECVGKTALINRICSGRFTEDRSPTLGSYFETKLIELDGRKIALQLWDTAVRDDKFSNVDD
jgi:small GTP-binding protein